MPRATAEVTVVIGELNHPRVDPVDTAFSALVICDSVAWLPGAPVSVTPLSVTDAEANADRTRESLAERRYRGARTAVPTATAAVTSVSKERPRRQRIPCSNKDREGFMVASIVRHSRIAAILLPGILCVPNAASAAVTHKRLPCAASVSNAHPRDYTTVDVNVKTASKAHVRTVAHYKTKNTAHTATANTSGKVKIAYRISDATKRFKVVVSVTVSKGSESGSCSTSFTPS